VLVTGADGQVGSRLVRQLLSRGYEVRGTVFPSPGLSLRRGLERMRSLVSRRSNGRSPRVLRPADRLKGLDLELMVGDLTDPAFAGTAVNGVVGVLHTANFVRPDAFENNVRVTFNVAQACAARAQDLRRLIYVSSSSVYPNDPHVVTCDYHPVDERHPRRPIGAYPASKLVGEETVWALARQSGLAASVVRPSFIVSGEAALDLWTVDTVCTVLRKGATNLRSELYAPETGNAWKELKARAASMEQPCAVTDPRGEPWVCQFVDARDAAHGILCAFESDAATGETFNLSGPRAVPYPEAAAIVAELTGEKALEYRAPVRWLFDLDNSKARATIGYAPRWEIRAMIEDAVAFRRGDTDGLQ
jgi:nucleoside-diphosphate-sugar epimerase